MILTDVNKEMKWNVANDDDTLVTRPVKTQNVGNLNFSCNNKHRLYLSLVRMYFW